MTRLFRRNPEFLRHIWLELTLSRLIILPIILLLLASIMRNDFFTGEADAESWSTGLNVAIAILAGLWGSRLAADTVVDDLLYQRRDVRRMTAMPPWSMAWGMLLGATSPAWYGVIWACFIFLVFMPESAKLAIEDDPAIIFWISRVIIGSLIAQVGAMFAALILAHSEHGVRQLRTTLCQAVGFGLAISCIALSIIVFETFESPTFWFGFQLEGSLISLHFPLLVLLWLIVGTWRLLRAEMGFRHSSAVWRVFLFFWLIYLLGFSWDSQNIMTSKHSVPLIDMNLVMSLLTFALITYIALFTDSKSSGRFAMLLSAKNRLYHRDRRITEFLPFSWQALFVTSLMVFIGPVLTSELLWFTLFFGMFVICQLIRDICFFMAYTLNYGWRAHLGGIIVLSILNLLIPALLGVVMESGNEMLLFMLTALLNPFLAIINYNDLIPQSSSISTSGLILVMMLVQAVIAAAWFKKRLSHLQ